MKPILHLITTIERGGAENQLKILVAKQIELGYSVDILYLKGEPELKGEFESLGARVISDFSQRAFIRQFFGFRSFIGNHYQVIHSHLPRAEILALCGLGRSKLVATKHNSESFLPASFAPLSRILAKFVFFLTDDTICISNAVRDYLTEIRELPKGSPRVFVVKYGWPKFTSEHLSTRKPPPFQKNEVISIGTISRLSPQKDLPTLFHSFARFLQIYPSATLEIVGSGPEAKNLESLAQSLGIVDKVRFLGRLDDVYAQLAEWDVFVLSSKYEGFGMVLLEAMQMMRPIVAPNNSSIPEVLGVDYPWLFSTGDIDGLTSQLINVCANLNEYDFAEFARERLACFSDMNMALSIGRIYSGRNAN